MYPKGIEKEGKRMKTNITNLLIYVRVVNFSIGNNAMGFWLAAGDGNMSNLIVVFLELLYL